MANCHFNQVNSHVPVCVVTDKIGKIHFSSQQQQLNTIDGKENSVGGWLLIGARAMISRFWSSSTATVMLTAQTLATSSSIPYLQEKYFLENEFCIWMGYIESIRAITQADLLEGNLVIVYTGILENIKYTGSNVAGSNLELQFRDRMKWLMDSTINLYQSELPAVQPQVNNLLPRSQVILGLARRAIGLDLDDTNQNSLGSQGAIIKGGVTHDIALDQRFLSPNVFVRTLDSRVSLGPRTVTLPMSSNVPTALFNIYTARRGIGLTANQNNISSLPDTTLFLIQNQITIEALKTLAFQEILPTELFQDNRNGDLFYTPRVNITTGYGKPEFNYRVYLYNPPNKVRDCVNDYFNANNYLLAYREESSTIGLKTNFILTNSSSMGGNADPFFVSQDSANMHLKVRPPNIYPLFASKFALFQDSTIMGQYEMAAVGLNMARIYARETKSGMAIMLGDPTFVPGEVIKVLGSPFEPYGGYIDKKTDKLYSDPERIVVDGFDDLVTYDNQWNDYIVDLAGKVNADPKAQETTQRLPNNNTLNINNGDVVPEKSGGWFGTGLFAKTGTPNYGREITEFVSTIESNGQIQFNDLPKSMWRVEAVMHKFNLGVKGYTTELALTKPY